MPQHQTILRCSQTTATILFITIGALFLLSGCYGLYKSIGLTDDQATAQATADQQLITQILHQSRTSTGQIITSAIAGLGAITSGILAKWLGTERKITASMIGAVEHAGNTSVKEAIKTHATAAGVETKLHRRVTTLT